MEDSKYWENMLNEVIEKAMRTCRRSKSSIPYTTGDNGIYDDLSYVDDEHPDCGRSWWTNGFYTGILWQLYNLTKEQVYADYAHVVEAKLMTCLDYFRGLHHDVGFMYLLSSVADYKMTGSPISRTAGLHAATILAGRFNLNGSYIRAWNGSNDEQTGLAIIDCMMNLSLLYWASEETKDPRFAAIAKAHTETVMKYFIREDGSAKHIVEFNPETGEYIKNHGGQGRDENSCWTRGQAWAIYGFINGYSHTHITSYLDTALRTADFFIEHMKEYNFVPSDFYQNTDPDAEQGLEDSSAACIAINGMLKIADILSNDSSVSEAYKYKADFYYSTAIDLLTKLCDHRIDLTCNSEALVRKCSVAYHGNHDTTTLIYADYFFIEALTKVCKKELPLW